MEVLNYYVTTLVNAFKNLAPYIAFLVGGYLVFVKMPFFFLKKSMDEQKHRLKEEEAKRVRIENQQSFKEQRKEKKEEKTEKKERPRKTEKQFSGFRPEDLISKETLKKRYLELIKENHPDRVASMGKEFKDLAEKNTKEINESYERLKKKAS